MKQEGEVVIIARGAERTARQKVRNRLRAVKPQPQQGCYLSQICAEHAKPQEQVFYVTLRMRPEWMTSLLLAVREG